MTRAVVTLPMYLSIGKNALNPRFANVRAIKQNTPIGATFIIAIVISIITSLNSLKKFATVEARLPNLANIIPTNNANTIIGSISPLAIEEIGFFGIIFKIKNPPITIGGFSIEYIRIV